MKVYKVTGYGGQYEESFDFCIGIFTTPKKADEAKRLFLAQLEEFKSRYTEEESSKFEESCDYDEHDVILPEYEKWWNWKYSDNHTITGDVAVQEIELDTMLYKFE